jgi:hypothetical protein
MGACNPVAIGEPDPHGVCLRQGPETCGYNGTCDGLGGCAKYPPGTNCLPPSCATGGLVYPYCQPDGTCRGGDPIDCSPSSCSGRSCKVDCTSDADCTPGHTCLRGSCGARGLGQTCGEPGQCQSGFCVDGVCCESACAGVCSSCALPSALGRCTPVPAGTPDPRRAAGVTDPARVCADQGAASCGTNGRCDGAGGCERYAAGTVCRAEQCDRKTNLWTPPGVCGPGGCVAPEPRGCAPYRCGVQGERCASVCASQDDCEAPALCAAGSCGKKAAGSLCSQAADCASGFCAQGICCTTACDQTCYACNLPNTLGICTALPEGAADFTGMCKDEGAASCGNDGTCNGSGACRKYNPDTICATQTCAKGVQTAPSYCSGTGKCLPGSAVACEPYVCNASGTACFSSCHGVGAAPECLAPTLCNDQRCGVARKGQACADTDDCAAGLTCIERVCCEGPCSGPCKTCKRIPGTCTDVPAGSTSGGCKVDPNNVCGNTGKCDGMGACARAPSTTGCATATCSGASAGKNAATCDGAGRCKMQSTFDCGANKCAAGMCTKCTKDADCLNGRACNVATGACASKGALGLACRDGGECASGSCVDGRCCEKTACGVCEACGTNGKCGPVKSAPDPDSCPDESASKPCGRIGCSDAGACAFTAAMAIVSGPTCKDATTVTVTTCDGAGGTRATEMACMPGWKCAGGACPTTCTSDAACVPPRGCVIPAGAAAGTCALRPLGSPCDTGEGCASGHCADGVCCHEACDGPCRACSAAGLCTTVKNAPDPDSCPNETASDRCGRTGCDAAGACRFVGAGSPCGEASCEGGGTVLASPRCNGVGGCTTERTDCSAAGKSCSAGMCVAPPADGGSD